MKTNTSLVNAKFNHLTTLRAAKMVSYEASLFATAHTFGDDIPDTCLDAYDETLRAFSSLKSALRRLSLCNLTELERARIAAKSSMSGTRASNRTITGIG